MSDNIVGRLYTLLRPVIECGLMGPDAREASFKALDAFQKAVHDEAYEEGRQCGAEEMQTLVRACKLSSSPEVKHG